MHELIAKRTLPARLIFGSRATEVTWSPGGLRLAGGNPSRTIPTASLVRPLEIAPGRFWSQLKVSTLTDRIVLRGYDAAQLASLVDAANEDIKVQAVARIARQSGALIEVACQIDALLVQNRFIRDSARRSTLQAAQAASSRKRDGLWDLYATQEQRSVFSRVGYFTSHSPELVSDANRAFVERQLERHRELFEAIESKPLTQSQRVACVTDDDNNLILAGAGTGKTSTMIGRTGYVLAEGLAAPEQILMIAYGRKAAEEMQERQDSRLSELLGESTPTIKTFHALGLEIIGKAEGRRPDISPMAEDQHAMAVFVDDQLELQCEEEEYKRNLVRYCGTERFPYRNPFDFESMEEYDAYVRDYELRTLKGEAVKSFEECVIANLLNKHGVPYEYEALYEIDTAQQDYRRYRPDFYLPEAGIYIEHFALDKDGNPPPHFKNYLDGVVWKRALHEENATTLLETYSYLKREDLLESTLLDKLKSAGVEFHPRSDEEMLAELRATSQVADLASLVGEFINLFKQSEMSYGEVWRTAELSKDSQRLQLLLNLIAPVLHAYTEELEIRGQIDFADMISRATQHVETGRYQSPYSYIMVDEFQDISEARARLVIALRDQNPECSLFAVGDDWQAIYRFAGSDIRFTTQFPRRFGASSTTSLETTFRFNSKISEVASKFILQNPEQITKRVDSLVQTSGPSVSLLRALSSTAGLELVLDAIAAREAYGSAAPTTVLVMARFHFVIDEWKSSDSKRALSAKYPGLRVHFSTVHAAKGKEADYVVVLGLDKGRYGFPSTKPTDRLLECLLPEGETFLRAEERRLFYVAITRARHRAYLVYNPMAASSFIRELLDEEHTYDVQTDEFRGLDACAELPYVSCPRCKDGALHPRSSEFGSFVGCNNYPYCEHTERPCPQCGSLMRTGTQERRCANAVCGTVIRLCPKCGGSLVERSGPYGKFLGCSNYRKGTAFVCTYKEKIESSARV